MTIKKCDRCKQIIKTEHPVNFGLLNLNEKLEEEEHDHQWSMFRVGPEYKEYKFELCIECANEMLHWAQHVENDLTVIKNAKKTNKT